MPLPETFPPFPGFRDEALAFLTELAAHNEREWFKPRKAVYDDELLWPARCLVADVARRAPAAGVPVTGDPRANVFRIYRDTRFSKNKAPYKSHVGLYLTPSGAKDDEGGVYVHVEPGACFLAAGFWAPAGPFLRAWRERLAADPGGWLSLVAEGTAAGLTFGPGPDGALTRMPRGFEALAGTEVADALRWKGTVARRDVADADVQSPGLTEAVVAFGRDALPLLAWGWDLTG